MPLTESHKQSESDGQSYDILTPDMTPGPTLPPLLSSEPIDRPIIEQDETGTFEDTNEKLEKPTSRNRAPRATEISADLDERLIISEPRTRKREAHHTAVQDPSHSISFGSTFAVGLRRPRERLHRDDESSSSKRWEELNP
jgi:hypothetical protein